MFCHRFNTLTTCDLFLADEQHEGKKRRRERKLLAVFLLLLTAKVVVVDACLSHSHITHRHVLLGLSFSLFFFSSILNMLHKHDI